MLLNRVILKYCTEEAGKEAFACARVHHVYVYVYCTCVRVYVD